MLLGDDKLTFFVDLSMLLPTRNRPEKTSESYSTQTKLHFRPKLPPNATNKKPINTTHAGTRVSIVDIHSRNKKPINTIRICAALIETTPPEIRNQYFGQTTFSPFPRPGSRKYCFILYVIFIYAACG